MLTVVSVILGKDALRDMPLLMIAKLKDVLQLAEKWPEEMQRQLAEIAVEIDREVAEGIYHPTAEELRAIDEARAAVRRGEVATDAEVEAVFAKHRRA